MEAAPNHGLERSFRAQQALIRLVAPRLQGLHGGQRARRALEQTAQIHVVGRGLVCMA